MIEKYFVILVFVTYGLLATLRPDLIARFQTWSNKTILGAQFKAGERTLKFYRAMGVLFLFIALFILVVD